MKDYCSPWWEAERKWRQRIQTAAGLTLLRRAIIYSAWEKTEAEKRTSSPSTFFHVVLFRAIFEQVTWTTSICVVPDDIIRLSKPEEVLRQHVQCLNISRKKNAMNAEHVVEPYKASNSIIITKWACRGACAKYLKPGGPVASQSCARKKLWRPRRISEW